jgi:hypothetical protein
MDRISSCIIRIITDKKILKLLYFAECEKWEVSFPSHLAPARELGDPERIPVDSVCAMSQCYSCIHAWIND